MKTVFNPNEIAHIWAHQQQDNGRTSSNNFYFKGDTIYSYGSHFPIAKHIGDKVLFTLCTYSNTTAKHISYVRGAISHKDKIYCYEIPYTLNDTNAHDKNIYQWMQAIQSEINSLKNARKPEKYINNINGLIHQLKEYTEFFKLKLSKNYKEIISIQDKAGFIALLDKQKQAEDRRNKQVLTKGKKLYEGRILAWKEYREDVYNKSLTADQKSLIYRYTQLVDENRTMLRTNGIEVETSKSITIPLEVAKRYYNWYLSVKDKGCKNCGYKMLSYDVTAANKERIIVGCHNVEISEIQAIAVKNNW